VGFYCSFQRNKVAAHNTDRHSIFIKWKIHDLDPFFGQLYYLLKNKKYHTDVKQHLKGLNFSQKLHNWLI
jgi:hypothetical protein